MSVYACVFMHVEDRGYLLELLSTFKRKIYLCIRACVHVYITCVQIPAEQVGSGRLSDPLELKLQALVSCPTQVLGTELIFCRSSRCS